MVSRSPARPGRPTPGAAPVAALGVLLLVLSGCRGEEAVPIDPANPPAATVDLTEVTHRIEPTEQMRAAAAEQCLDDPSLDEGYVRAVEPDSERVVAEITVDCDEVRGGG